ncbi:sugar phosphate isomerase/epimerase family protein [Francisella sp. SYW-2]|uniref:sugar phosphate isomerase/epimerase family protein n=1 Tax=Francisella sp. SYW-2 TaxID=2610886 RepID=UPI00123CEA29|nr:sugar phosphate isomerase/epimerase family protein [Francisella sp. SYW-2]
MKLAISNIAWNDSHQFYYSQMQKFGFTGLEIAPTKFSDNPYDNLAIAEQVKNELLQYKLSVVSMQSLLFGTDNLNLFKSKESRAELKNYLKKAIVYAEVIGCPVLVFGNPKNRIMQDSTIDYDIAISFFKELGDFAAKHNTCLCIEPNPTEYGTNFINSLSEADKLVNGVKSDGFAMIVDSSTMMINGNSPKDILPVIENTKHIHISMPFLKPLNKEYESNKKWILEFINTIKNSGFNEYVSIEMANVSKDDVLESINIINHISNNG